MLVGTIEGDVHIDYYGPTPPLSCATRFSSHTPATLNNLKCSSRDLIPSSSLYVSAWSA